MCNIHIYTEMSRSVEATFQGMRSGVFCGRFGFTLGGVELKITAGKTDPGRKDGGVYAVYAV
jgi:hypothetical protein